MPAITMKWPEAGYFGYDQVFAAGDLGYEGKPFNWVTMPDQFTLSAFERLVRQPAEVAQEPVMAEIALVSSHAPWTPVPKLVDWDKVGHGQIFDDQAENGDPPAVVWADPARVRTQYIQTIDYTLQTLCEYILRFGDDSIFIILGDHQPAPIITGPDASHAVPIHVISRDASLIHALQSKDFDAGLVPASDAPETPMNMMRERLVGIFSKP